MPAIQTLMVAAITEGTDLGNESCSADDFGSVKANSSAAITFNTNGAVTFSASGSSTSNTAPATNWNTNGGTFISYEVISQDGTGSVENGPFESTLYGENRQDMTTSSMSISAFASALLNEPPDASGFITIKVSVWDAASGGSRKAYGVYSVSATASISG